MKDCLKRMCQSFFVITTLTLLMTAIFTTIFTSSNMFPLSLLWQVLIFSLSASLLGILFYSRHELSKKQMFLRQLIHMILLTSLLSGLAFLFDWIDISVFAEGITFLLMIVFVYILVWTICYRSDENEAKKIKEGIKNFQSR